MTSPELAARLAELRARIPTYDDWYPGRRERTVVGRLRHMPGTPGWDRETARLAAEDEEES